MVDIVQNRDFSQTRDMPTTTTERTQEHETSTMVAGGGSMAEALCGIAVIVLSIVGLANVWPVLLAGIAAIVLGAGLWLQGASLGGRYARFMDEVAGSRFSLSELGGGLGGTALAGAAGIVLGILAVIGIASLTLISVAAIVFGAALLLGAGASASLTSLMFEHNSRTPDVARRLSGAMASTGCGTQVLVGLTAAILGIIGLASGHALTLSLVAYLCAGAALTLCGGFISAKMFTLNR